MCVYNPCLVNILFITKCVVNKCATLYYTNYRIIGEYGKDIIFKNNNNATVGDEIQTLKECDNYDGVTIPTEILNKYYATGYNKHTDFLKSNKIHNGHGDTW